MNPRLTVLPRLPCQIVEELFDRLTEDEVATVLSLVRTSLAALPVVHAPKPRVAANGFGTMEGDDDDEDDEAVYGDWDADMEQGGDEAYEIDEVDA